MRALVRERRPYMHARIPSAKLVRVLSVPMHQASKMQHASATFDGFSEVAPGAQPQIVMTFTPLLTFRPFAPVRSSNHELFCAYALGLISWALNMAVLVELTPCFFLADMNRRQPDTVLSKLQTHDSRDCHQFVLEGVVTTTASLGHHHLPSVAIRHRPSVVDYDILLSPSSCFCALQHQSVFHKDTQTCCENLIASPSFTLYNGRPSSFA